MLFILMFALLTFALPVAGEVWAHGKENVITRSKEEVITVVEPYLEMAAARAGQAKEKLAWVTLASFVVRVFVRILSWVIDLATKIMGQ